MYQLNIAGRLGKDAETRSTQGGDSVTSFSVAVDVRTGKDTAPRWVTCSMWGDRGQKVAPYLRKGTAVSVSGQLNVRQYESNGKPGVAVECRVSELTLLGGGKAEEEQEERPAPARPAPARRAPPPSDELDDEIPF